MAPQRATRACVGAAAGLSPAGAAALDCGFACVSAGTGGETLQADDGQPDLPSGGHAELPGGGQCDYLL
jgi:hypothetical protein